MRAEAVSLARCFPLPPPAVYPARTATHAAGPAAFSAARPYVVGTSQSSTDVATSTPKKHAAFAGKARTMAGPTPL